MTSKTCPITCLPVPAGQSPPPRQEITAWCSKADNAIQVSLFIQALNIFQAIDPSDKYPTTKWAYVALFEQLLSGIMTDQILPTIANKIVHDVWALEIRRWRLPYWDWATPQDYIKSCGVPEIVLQRLSNPLYKFTAAVISKFKGASPTMGDSTAFGKWAVLGDDPFSACSGTSRYGITNNDTPTPQEALGVENNGSVANALDIPQWVKMELKTGKNLDPNMKGSLQDQVHRLLTQGYFSNYATFATTEYGDNDLKPPPATGWLSIEFLHNCVHVWTGGAEPSPGIGHMSDIGVAAFDPIFWLHHCNVDRQLAIFQALNLTHWFDGGSPTKDETADGPLHPFHSDTNATLVTSNVLRNITSYGYTYDDLNVPVQDLKQAINEKYGSLRKHLKANPDVGGRTNDYLINVRYDRFALNGRRYAVHFFLKGDIPSEPSEYRASPSHIGSIHTFSTEYWTAGNKNGVDCQNCQSQQERRVKAKAQIPITLELLFRAVSLDNAWSDLNYLEAEHIQQYLEQHLKWVVVAVPGEVIPTDNFPGLKVVVHAGKGHHPEDTTQPSRFHSYRPMWSVTHGKAGGACREDGIVHAEELQG
ncbi:hypothetical protein BDP55DRAFT_714015 [Colletotrichum godetiae]|uniref:tyrosinase n=1 Tax=Colletotrichum godetiae TaxID=1209918 RepID=A0AAJ0ARN6_9PEZI|nr:uncharacterized protein BDP55DRAFT_714015 [Colletotrichum godetiae]KAK1687691.1 hypothetical protein BDP55DRAFT_714015 [Colletotrichum godetiae]